MVLSRVSLPVGKGHQLASSATKPTHHAMTLLGCGTRELQSAARDKLVIAAGHLAETEDTNVAWVLS